MTKKAKILRIILLVIVVLTLAFIFSNSIKTRDDSSEQSSRFRMLVQPFFELFLGKGNVTDHFIRKFAHFSEFALLGLELSLLFKRFGLLPFFAMLVTALTDETIQIFSGRGSMVSDVWLDYAGAVTGFAIGIGVIYLIRRIISLRAEKRNRLKQKL